MHHSGFALKGSSLALALLLAPLAPCALAADAPASPCGPDTDWSNFTTLKLAIAAERDSDGLPFSLRIEHTVYDDGMHLVSLDNARRTEVVALRRDGGRVELASDPGALRQLGEIGMVYGVPLTALRRRVRALCELADHASHPVKLQQGSEAIAGNVRLDGDELRFDLLETGAQGRISYSGSVSYHRPRGTLPTSLAIAGWTVFSGPSSAPGDGVPSAFKTLGEFEASLAAGAPAK